MRVYVYTLIYTPIYTILYYTKLYINYTTYIVGTPLALESALTKSRGLVGRWETVHKAQGDLLPGGFDHFDWVIYDEGKCCIWCTWYVYVCICILYVCACIL